MLRQTGRDTPVATKTIRRVTDWSKLLGQRSTVGGSARRRATTCVKPEQASKGMRRGPTGLTNREGRWSPWEHPTDDHGLVRRGQGRGTPAQHTGQHGRSHAARPRASLHREGGATWEVGGAHSTDGISWTTQPRERVGALVRGVPRREKDRESGASLRPPGVLRRLPGALDFTAELARAVPVHAVQRHSREPDAGNPPVRFDERTGETPDRCGWR